MINFEQVLADSDMRAALTYGWRDHPPLGFYVLVDGSVTAVAGHALYTEPYDVMRLVVRAALPVRARVAGLGLMLAAWGSREAAKAYSNPDLADDRFRVRFTVLADFDGGCHTYSAHADTGEANYTFKTEPAMGVEQLATEAAAALRERVTLERTAQLRRPHTR